MAHISRSLPDGLRTGDRVDCDVRGLFPLITRGVTCGGWFHLFDYSRATHTGMVVIESAGAPPSILEMDQEGCELHSLDAEYINVWDSRIIQFSRHPAYDSDATRAVLLAKIIRERGLNPGYDFAGLFNFIDVRVAENTRRQYCSELYYTLTMEDVATYGDPYPKRFGECVSPFDLQSLGGGWTVFYRYP